MTAAADNTAETKAPDGTCLGIDSSSWVAWLSYYAGFQMALAINPQAANAITAGESVCWALVAAVIAFFVIIIPIQRYMTFSLRASTYGEPAKLVSGGVFQYSRNPIYLAFLIPLASLALVSVAASVIAIAGYVYVMTRWVIAREERVLERNFGQDYLDYKSKIRRWI